VILLDTDHLTVLKYIDSERYARLHGRLLAAAPELIGTTIVNVEEQMRGWLSAIAKERKLMRQITAYRELTDLFDFFAKFNIISLSADAIDVFTDFRKSGIKIESA
jgi:tRNA(fMet)-specific endonuclease VapC